MFRNAKPFTENAKQIIRHKYLYKHPKTLEVLETIEDFFPRVAKSIANVDRVLYGVSEEKVNRLEQKFLEAMDNHRIIPAGRTLANGGLDTAVVPNCVVLEIKDSLKSIFQTQKDACLLQQLGSGIGFCFSDLRETGSIVSKSRSSSSGPISFLRVYHEAFSTIQQQNRHGALMATFSVNHPDILEFIDSKKKEGDIYSFNISVLVTDDFMDQATNPDHPKYNDPWICSFDGRQMKPRQITRGPYCSVQIEEMDITANEILNKIAYNGWRNGEPGLIFIDEGNRTNPLPGLGPIKATNPCGEQLLHDGDVCCLININLEEYYDESNNSVKWDLMAKDLKIAVHLGDNVVDMYEVKNVPRVEETIKKNRRMGIGPMGFANLCIKMGIVYGSEECLNLIDEIGTLWQTITVEKSRRLAEIRGPFPNFDKSIYFQRNEPFRRNTALTNSAPTGTISRIANTSSGIEPNFAFFYNSNIMGTVQKTSHHLLEKALKEVGIELTNDLLDRIKNDGSIQKIDEIPFEIKRIFLGAMDLSVEAHIGVQAKWQEYLENSISKTINYREDATVDEVLKGYILSWKSKCKGFTMFRDKSRDKQVLETGSKKTDEPIPQSPASSSNSEPEELEENVSSLYFKNCKECQSPQIISESGCIRCVDCDWTPCNG